MNPEASPLPYPVHDLSPFLIQFSENFGIRYYGLAYVLGFVLATWMIWQASRTRRAPLAPKQVEPLLFYLIVGVMLGGRLGSVLLYDFPQFLERPWMVVEVWKGGMASHGGFIGVAVAVLLFAWRHQLSALRLGDLVAFAAPPGLFFGRVANYINGELWGKVWTGPWARIFPEAPTDPSDPAAVFVPELMRTALPRHPSQLYEAALEGLVLGVFIWVRYWPRRAVPLPAGRVLAEFLIAYPILRIIGEQFREPDASLFLGLSRGTFYSLLTMAIGLALWVWTARAAKSELEQKKG